MSLPPQEALLVNTGSVDNPVPVSQAILDGYAPGNELYNYPQYPKITSSELESLLGQDYPTIFYELTKKLLAGAIPDEVLRTTAQEAYSPNKFDFDKDGSLRVTHLESGIKIVGLSDGPTAAFKDMAMQPFALWMDHLLKSRDRRLTILLSTSGDTGPAALNAFGGLSNVEIINMLPNNGVSPFQWAQMAQLADKPGVHVLEVEGDFSYLNDLQMAADRTYDIGAVNSVNIARIIAQVSYHAAAYLRTIELENKEVGDSVDVSVPSGNFGNALAAIIARKMGVPFREIIVATNENNTLDTLFHSGVFKTSDLIHTDSSAQDVRMPSNVWRYFAMLFENDPEKIDRVYQTLTSVGSVAIEDIGIEDKSVWEGISSATITAPSRARTIKDTVKTGVLIDPHTANGVAAIEKLRGSQLDVPTITYETAKPFKFDQAMEQILGIKPPRPARFEGLEESQSGKKLVRIADETELLAYLADHTQAAPK